MVALRDGISLHVFNSISHSFAVLTFEISSWTLWGISYFHASIYYSPFIWLFSQVVDYAEYGNLHESMPNQSVPSLVQTVTQLASALEYLENKNMKHRGLSWTSVFVMKPGKVWNGSVCVASVSSMKWEKKTPRVALINSVWSLSFPQSQHIFMVQWNT